LIVHNEWKRSCVTLKMQDKGELRGLCCKTMMENEALYHSKLGWVAGENERSCVVLRGRKKLQPTYPPL